MEFRAMLNLSGLSLARGSRMLIEGATAQLFPGHKAGLIGANGSGKSSLFALLRGELLPEAGEASLPPSWVVAHVAQETPALECSALDYVLDGDREYRAIQSRLDTETDGHELAELYEQLRVIDGYTAPSRAQRLLAGLGFEQAAVERPVASFSGGWRMRLNLAQALMCRSDLLLLDEPTNHLDLDAVLWLEGYLRDWPGTVLVIAHDRDFLDAVVNQVWHVDQGRLTTYSGNFSRFERTRAEQLANQQSTFERQQRAVAHLQSYIDRFRAKATKARQAQSRIKALERLELVAAVRADQEFEFSFPLPAGSPSPLLVLDRAAVGYGERTILANITLTLMPGARIGLLGRNGAGKSTLVKLLTGSVKPMAGERVEGRGLQIGYFAQHQLESLDGAASPMLHLKRIDPRAREQALRDFLGGFRFQGERVDQAVAGLSGGERARLALALICWTRPNLLILDEPTNHLDMTMRDALTFALQEYEGAVVLVSHDRQLVRSTAEDLFLVEDGAVTTYDGDLDDYAARLAQRASAAAAAKRSEDAQTRVVGTASGAGKTTASVPTLPPARKAAQIRDQSAARRRPLVRQVEALEKQLASATDRLAACEQTLADQGIYAAARKAELQSALQDRTRLKDEQARLEGEWLAAQEKLDAFDIALGISDGED
jgi:ATP-binding cassette subfamily F protein 3